MQASADAVWNSRAEQGLSPQQQIEEITRMLTASATQNMPAGSLYDDLQQHVRWEKVNVEN